MTVFDTVHANRQPEGLEYGGSPLYPLPEPHQNRFGRSDDFNPNGGDLWATNEGNPQTDRVCWVHINNHINMT